MQAAAGLAAAHAGGLIHRDIKPGNILLESPADRVKLTDFGLARAVEDVKLTRTGFVAGSPLYMAPEQARGDEVDHRSDLFSLGSVLYEAATGKSPFEAKTPLAVLRRVSDEVPPLLTDVDPEIPHWLSEMVAKLFDKNPAERPQSAAEVAEAFASGLARSHALSPLDVPAEVCSGAGSRTGTAPRARKKICWGGVACRVAPWLGGAILGALLTSLLWPPPVVEKVIEKPVEVHSNGNGESGPAPKVILQGNSGTVWALGFLGEDQLIVGMDDGQVKIWDLKTAEVTKTLEPRQGGTIWSVDVSSDGKYLVITCDDASVPVWNLDTFKVEYSFPQQTSTKAAVFSPDGSKVATGDRNSTIRVWDIAAQIPVELRGHRGTVYSLAFSPDGTKLASAGSDGAAKVWNWADPDSAPTTLGEHRGPVYAVAFSPDGTKLATTGWDGTVRLWDAAKGSLIKTIKAHDGDAWSVSFGGGGKWVASAGQDGVRVWDVDTGHEVFAYRGKRAIHVVRFAKDGTTLAGGGRDGNVRVWDIGK
jgi:WD40 repeat protein